MRPGAREALRAAIAESRDGWMRAGERAVAASPELAAASLGDDDLNQLLNGFEALMLEALEERGDETRRLFLETAVPALVAGGQTPASLVHGAAAFSVLLATEIVPLVSEEHRGETAGWLAGFLGAYCRDLVEAATVAEAP